MNSLHCDNYIDLGYFFSFKKNPSCFPIVFQLYELVLLFQWMLFCLLTAHYQRDTLCLPFALQKQGTAGGRTAWMQSSGVRTLTHAGIKRRTALSVLARKPRMFGASSVKSQDFDLLFNSPPTLLDCLVAPMKCASLIARTCFFWSLVKPFSRQPFWSLVSPAAVRRRCWWSYASREVR